MSLASLLEKELSQGKFWTHAWSLVEGCTPVSPGCRNCWLAGMYSRNLPNLPKGLIDPMTRHFNGSVAFGWDRLDVPLGKGKPKVYAVWSDLFHESVSPDFIGYALMVMALAPRHRFIIVTKRPQRAADYLAGPKSMWQTILSNHAWKRYGDEADCRVHNAIEGCLGEGCNVGWPFSNVIILVTMEDQQRADERAPHALQLASMGWNVGALCEPLIGPINLKRFAGYDGTNGEDGAEERGWGYDSYSGGFIGKGDDLTYDPRCGFDWIITGGESGPGARPAHPDWIRSLRDQAQAAGVPFLFKQWGEWLPTDGIDQPVYRGEHKHLGGPWHAFRIGKKAAGRMLDGREWLEVPCL